MHSATFLLFTPVKMTHREVYERISTSWEKYIFIQADVPLF